MLEQINQTQLILICKKHEAKTITQYRLIILRNTLCKMVTKVLVNSLRPLLNELVHPALGALYQDAKQKTTFS